MQSANENLVTVASLLRKLRRRDEVSEEEAQTLADMMLEPALIKAGVDIVKEGERPTASTLLVDGFVARYRLLENGARQITALHVAGDFVDLHSFLLKQMDHGVVCLTDCVVSKAPHAALTRISQTHPHLTRLFWLLTLIDGSIHREWLVGMGRQSALQHAAHLICELYTLLSAVELTDGYTFPLPITQAVLGDVLGLSSVHVNRVVQELRTHGLIRWDGKTAEILNWPQLQQTAEFDPTYLHLVQEPR